MASPEAVRARVLTGQPSLAPMLGVSALVASAYLVSLLQLTSAQGVAFGVLTQLAFVAPGVLVVRAAAGPAIGWLAPLTFGPLVGMAASSLALLGLWAAGAREGWALIAAPAAASALAWPARRLEGRVRLAATLTADWPWLLLLLLIVPLVVARPFSLVGAEVDGGHVYRAYFTADYVWRRAVVSELAKGDFLPVNPFYEGDALHYYWLPHLLSALEYRVARRALGLDQLLLMWSVFVDAMFVAFLYGVTRLFVSRAWAVAGGVLCAILFTSFEGAYSLWDHWRMGAPYGLVRYLNIDAITRWMLEGMPIDGLHRVLLDQPHHALGYAIGFTGLMVIARRTRRDDPTVFAIGGALLGLSVLISSFGGLMFTAIAAVYEATLVIRARDWRRATRHAAAALAPLSIAAGLVVVLQYVDRGGQVIIVGLNSVATHRFFASTMLSFGPALLLVGAGTWVAWRRRRADLLVFAAFAVTCVFFYFFVDIRDHANVYVGWRVGHLLFMAGGVLTALLLDYVGTLQRHAKMVAVLATGTVAAMAAPTVAIDLYNTQDVANTRMGPGFRWTLVLSHDDLEAFDWIKANTPPAAVFQVDALARDSETWTYLPALAERRMAVGLPISMVPLTKYQRGSALIREMLGMPNAAETYTLATQFGIRYLLSGPPERGANPGLQTRLDSRTDLFPLLFRNNSISIYAVAPKPRAPELDIRGA